MKIRLVEADFFFHADGQRDGHGEANTCFSHFCKRSWSWTPSAGA